MSTKWETRGIREERPMRLGQTGGWGKHGHIYVLVDEVILIMILIMLSVCRYLGQDKGRTLPESVQNITSQVVMSLRSADDDDGDVDVDSNHKFATIATMIIGIW